MTAPNLLAVTAATEYGEVMRVDGETELFLGAFGEAHEQLVGCFEGVAAVLADEVTVRAGGQVVRGRSMSEMGMDDDPEALELFQVAIDGRQVHVRGSRLDDGGQVLGAVVSRVVEDGLQEQAP